MLLFLWCLLLDFASSTKIPESISHFWKPTLSSCPLFILLAFARSAWLPGVRKYHNYLVNICPGLPANQVSIAENSKKENRNLLRRNKLVFRHSSRKLPRNKFCLLGEIGDHVDLCGVYSSINLTSLYSRLLDGREHALSPSAPCL